MVSKYSKNPEAAADLVRYLTSEDLQKRGAIELSRLPTRPKLYHGSDVLAANPWSANVLEVLNNAVARPSTILGVDYPWITPPPKRMALVCPRCLSQTSARDVQRFS